MHYRRAEGGRGLTSVDDCIEIEVNSLFGYVVGSNEPLLKAIKYGDLLSPGAPEEAVKVKGTEACKENILHGQYQELTVGIMRSDSLDSPRKGTLKKEIEC